ncbi:uncharacterized protein LOC123516302 isoform X2 [Portunus trituberculatus]|uniref:uncharacterized protein LOC123516302 isoform X2 n=1 Tax=Portunus trituberculatus TaxID=210409 RepID=UPI001E1CD919|nr:uncharacterized protein LOC123516302 isoform X2 [Portunus trituberculatus]
MRKSVKLFIVFNTAFCSVLSLLTIFLYYNHSVNTVIFGLIIPLFFVCLWLSWYSNNRQLTRATQQVRTSQTEDVESGQGDASSEDAPPIYETVVAKPPPYDSLYESCNLPVCGGDDEEAEPGVSDGSKDSDLPTYTQAAQALTPV